VSRGEEAVPLLERAGPWSAFPEWAADSNLPDILSDYLPCCRWFGDKSRKIAAVAIESILPLQEAVEPEENTVYLCILSVGFSEGPPRRYLLPLGQGKVGEGGPAGPIARVPEGRTGPGYVTDGLFLPRSGRKLLSLFDGGRPDPAGLKVLRTPLLPGLLENCPPDSDVRVFGGEQSNTSLLFDKCLILKCFRTLGTGTNPDLEVGAFLSEAVPPAPIPPTGGAITGFTPEGRSLTLAMLQGLVENDGDGWRFMLERLGEIARSRNFSREGPVSLRLDRMIDRLGRRTAELHQALGRDPRHPDFAPVPLSADDLDQLVLSVEGRHLRVDRMLREASGQVPPQIRGWIDRFAGWSGKVGETLASCRRVSDGGSRIRCHGDFHLGQLLVTPGDDVVFLDFEGEPALPIEERREKASPFLDVAGMLRSLHYLVVSSMPGEPDPEWEGWLATWLDRQAGRYLQAYLERMEAGPAALLPGKKDADALLTLYLIRKALYEIEYEFNNRPGWVWIPLAGLEALVLPAGLPGTGAGERPPIGSGPAK